MDPWEKFEQFQPPKTLVEGSNTTRLVESGGERDKLLPTAGNNAQESTVTRGEREKLLPIAGNNP